MVGYTQILLLSIETILVISCSILLTEGLPLPVKNHDEQEIRVDISSTIDCKLNQNKNSAYCAYVSVVIILLSHQLHLISMTIFCLVELTYSVFFLHRKSCKNMAMLQNCQQDWVPLFRFSNFDSPYLIFKNTTNYLEQVKQNCINSFSMNCYWMWHEANRINFNSTTSN